MPYARKICGVYQVQAPDGKRYIGGSTNVLLRWCEHRYHLRRGTHHSRFFQDSFNEHGEELFAFSMIEECARDELLIREQVYMDSLKPELNVVTKDVTNHWSSEEIREKLRAIHTSPEWKAARSVIASNSSWRRPVVCSDGREFGSMAEAARAVGTRTPHIKYLVEHHRPSKRLGVGFRFANEEWKVKPAGTAAKPVVGTCVKTGEVIEFPSATAAAKRFRPGGPVVGQISSAVSGRTKSAYGFTWRFAA